MAVSNLLEHEKVFLSDQEGIKKAIEVLNNGGVAILPADTVYGFFTCATNFDSIERVYNIKHRERRKPFVIYTNKEKVNEVVYINDYAQKFIDTLWPQALSLILPKKPIIPDWFTDLPTVGVMTAQNPVLSEVLKSVVHPIIGTTCNISGELELKKAEEVFRFIDQVDILLADDTIPIYNKPSTMIDCSVAPPKVIRISSLSVEEVQAVVPEVQVDLDRRIK